MRTGLFGGGRRESAKRAGGRRRFGSETSSTSGFGEIARCTRNSFFGLAHIIQIRDVLHLVNEPVFIKIVIVIVSIVADLFLLITVTLCCTVLVKLRLMPKK